MNDIVDEFAGQGYGKLKTYVADVVCAELEKIQNKYHDIINTHLLDEIMSEGAKKANLIAEQTLKNVENKIGLKIKY